MTTYPLPTLAPTISATGISAPSYADILASLQASVQTIYGADIVLDPSSQDGEFLAIFAKAQNDANNAIIAAYNSYAPTTAQGTGLSNSVKINGLARENSSNSQAIVTVVGQAGTIITNGLVGDNLNLNTQWALPSPTVIPGGGTIDVTATCTVQGATIAAPGTLTQILTPTRGWQSVTNADAASPGNPVEDDATLRQRQAASTALPAQSVFDGILGTIGNLPGVERLAGYENDTGTADGNGIPGHSISIVVQGGDAQTIAQVILDKKTPGTGTYGTTNETVFDQYGIEYVINFYELALTTIYVIVNIKALTGYLSTTGDAIVAALSEYLNTNPIGGKVYFNRLYAPADLSGTAAVNGASDLLGTPITQAQLDAMSATYEISTMYADITPAPAAQADIAIAFNKAATGTNVSIIVNVVP